MPPATAAAEVAAAAAAATGRVAQQPSPALVRWFGRTSKCIVYEYSTAGTRTGRILLVLARLMKYRRHLGSWMPLDSGSTPAASERRMRGCVRPATRMPRMAMHRSTTAVVMQVNSCRCREGWQERVAMGSRAHQPQTTHAHRHKKKKKKKKKKRSTPERRGATQTQRETARDSERQREARSGTDVDHSGTGHSRCGAANAAQD